VRPPEGAEIAAPEFPPKMAWLNVAFLRIDRLLGANAVLIEFFDTARVNSHRTLPYVQGWDARYREHGLRTIGVHSPGYSFGRDPEVVERLASEMGVRHPVVLDPDFAVWRLYGNQGWPARYLFDFRGYLRDVHYGEGGYAGTEAAIAEVLAELDEDFEAPEPLKAMRPEDEEGALLEPQTADIALPGDRSRLELGGEWSDGKDWIEAAAAGATATASFTAGGAWAVLSGAVEPGLYETGGTVTAEQAGLRLHGLQFTPSAP
jgi:hypothetical protein